MLITGSTGFVGQNLVKRLLETTNYRIYVIVRNIKKFKQIFGNMNNSTKKLLIPIYLNTPEKQPPEKYTRIFSKYKISKIIHIGAISGEQRLCWSIYNAVNILWTRNLLLGLLNYQIPNEQKKFIFTSTVGVYGTIPIKLPADEKTPYNPDGKYHLSKMIAEQFLIKIKEKYQIPIVILRPTTIYGTGDHGFIYKIIRLYHKNLLFYSNHYLHILSIDNLIKVYQRILEMPQDFVDPFIFNICDQQKIQFSLLIDIFRKNISGNAVQLPKVIFKFAENVSKLINSSYLKIRIQLLYSDRFYANNLIKEYTGLRFERTEQEMRKYAPWYFYSSI